MSVIIDINGELVLDQSAGLPTGTDGYDVEVTNSAVSWAVPSTKILARRRAKSAMAELDMQILNLTTKRLNEAVDELSKVEGELFGLKQQERSAQVVLTRADVVAPVGGILMDLKFHTTGGVVKPGETLMTVVPLGQTLVVEAMVKPEDIETIAPGRIARPGDGCSSPFKLGSTALWRPTNGKSSATT